jgi:CheY-like chemotaxis protein
MDKEAINRNRYLLLVEDNPDDIELTIRAIKKHHITNELIICHDGAEALDFLFARGSFCDRDINDKPRFVLLDLKLPKIDGLEVLRQIRADNRTKLIPVVIFSSSTEQRDMFNVYSEGANSYIRKPVEFEQYSESIRQVGTYWLILNEVP